MIQVDSRIHGKPRMFHAARLEPLMRVPGQMLKCVCFVGLMDRLNTGVAVVTRSERIIETMGRPEFNDRSAAESVRLLESGRNLCHVPGRGAWTMLPVVRKKIDWGFAPVKGKGLRGNNFPGTTETDVEVPDVRLEPAAVRRAQAQRIDVPRAAAQNPHVAAPRT